MDRWDFVRFKFKMSLGGITFIETGFYLFYTNSSIHHSVHLLSFTWWHSNSVCFRVEWFCSCITVITILLYVTSIRVNIEHIYCYINSLAPGKFEWNFRYLILQIISVIDGWGISCQLALRLMSLDLTDDKSTLVQVMAWCRQATSHYLSQY